MLMRLISNEYIGEARKLYKISAEMKFMMCTTFPNESIEPDGDNLSHVKDSDGDEFWYDADGNRMYDKYSGWPEWRMY